MTQPKLPRYQARVRFKLARERPEFQRAVDYLYDHYTTMPAQRHAMAVSLAVLRPDLGWLALMVRKVDQFVTHLITQAAC